MIDFQNKIIICPDEIKPLFLRKKAAEPGLNFKIYNLSSLERGLFGEIDSSAIPLGMKKINPNFNIIKKYVSYIQKGFNIKENKEIEALYKLILDNHLIYIDEDFPFLFFNKEIIFVGYKDNSNEVKHCLEFLNPLKVEYCEFKDVFPSNKNFLYEFNNSKDEINYVLTSIMDLLSRGIKPSDIILFTDISTNYFLLETYRKEYGLVFNYSSGKTLYDLPIAKQIEKEISSMTYDELSKLDDGSEDFILIKNEIVHYDLLNLPLKLTNFKSIMKTIKIHDDNDFDGIKVTDKLIFDDQKYIFATNIDNSFFIKVQKNNDILDDVQKELGQIDTTDTINIFNSDLYSAFLNFSDKLLLSYSKISGQGVENPSYFFTKQFSKNEVALYIKCDEYFYGYSRSIEKVNYSHLIYLFNNYSVASEKLFSYKKEFELLETYNYKFKNFQFDKNLDNYKIYYSNIKQFYECPFKFYCSNVLKLDEFEDNFSTKVGNLIHKIYEKLYCDGFNFDDELNKHISEYNFDSKEDIFLKKVLFNAKNISSELLKYKTNSLISKTFSELNLSVKSSSGHNIGGKIDSILVSEYENLKGIQIIDYKTGFVSSPTKDNEFGINLQLPIYSYVVEKSEQFSSYQIAGIYYVKVMDGNNEFCKIDKETGDFIYEVKPLKSGITSKNIELDTLFEPQLCQDTKSQRIESLSFNKKTNSLSGNCVDISYSKNADDNGELEIIPSMLDQFFDYFIAQFKKGNFIISPFYSSDSDKTACKFCNFKDVCFKKKSCVRVKEGLFELKTSDKENV